MVSDLSRAIEAVPIVAIVRSPRRDRVGAVVDALADAGVRCIEIPLTTPGALEEIAAARSRLSGRALIGAGTVLGSDSAHAAIDHGAQFLVTPTVACEVANVGEGSIPVVMGAFTPTEVLSAHSAGAWAVKVFPASLCGPDYIRALRDPLPEVGLIPTGGITSVTAKDWLAQGALAVALGSSLVGEALASEPLAKLFDRARELVRTVA